MFPRARLGVAVFVSLLTGAIQFYSGCRPAFAASPLDGQWIVDESCGENPNGKDPATKQPYNLEIELSVTDGRITGSKHSVNPKTNSVSDITYQGTLNGSSIHISGVGHRSNLDKPWNYTYEGKVGADGKPQINGEMTSAGRHLRSCALRFVVRDDGTPLHPASGETVGDILMIRNAMADGFRKECQTATKPNQGQKASDAFDECVTDKLKGSLREALEPPFTATKEIPLIEPSAMLVKPNVGPADAKGVVYFVSGYSHSPDDYTLAPYLLKSLADDGWDVILARLPQDAVDDTWQADSYQLKGGTAFVKRRIRELKSSGYKKIVLAGFSWGGWVTLAAAQQPDLPIDSALVLAPVILGHRLYQEKPNRFFDMNIPEFADLLGGNAKPTVAIFPKDPIDEPSGPERGLLTNVQMLIHNTPHLVISDPPGLSGHYAPWLPFFDFAYGKCIANFLDHPTDGGCRKPAISNDDFRSILSIKQLDPKKAVPINSATGLMGRKFAAYVLRDEDFRILEFKSVTERLSEETSKSFSEPVSFRKSAFCAGSKCSILVQWSNDVILEFEAGSGELKSWWIAEK